MGTRVMRGRALGGEQVRMVLLPLSLQLPVPGHRLLSWRLSSGGLLTARHPALLPPRKADYVRFSPKRT